ncbi:MAG: hypothetical protein ACFE89_06570 [Candidatus Hodarchaeota archaeon]
MSTEIPIGELSPSLAFGAAYFCISSIGTRLLNIAETYTEEGFFGTATVSFRMPNAKGRLELTLLVDSQTPIISLELSGGEPDKLPDYVTEITKRIKETMARFSAVPGVKLSHASKAVVVERKLDEALNQLLTDPDYRKVYVQVADARERLIRIGGDFQPATLEMSAVLTPLANKTGPIPKEEHEELALSLLRWKKEIKKIVNQLTAETDED